MHDRVARQRDQAEQPAIVEPSEVVVGTASQAIDISHEFAGVQRRAGAKADQVDTEHPDVANGAQLLSQPAGFGAWSLLAEDRQRRHTRTKEPTVADDRRRL